MCVATAKTIKVFIALSVQVDVFRAIGSLSPRRGSGGD
jgi:hypothetical protein